MRFLRSAAAAAFLLAALPAAGAQEISKSYAACMEKTGGVTAAMQDCIATEYDAQDKRLNAAYKDLTASVPEKRRALLRDAQRRWVAFRDSNCAYYADPDGGSAARLAANECMLRLTAARASELENLK